MARSIHIKQLSFLTVKVFPIGSYTIKTALLLFSKRLNLLCIGLLHFNSQSIIINLNPYHYKGACYHPISYSINIDIIYINTTYTIESLFLILTKGKKYFLFIIGKNKFNSRRAML